MNSLSLYWCIQHVRGLIDEMRSTGELHLHLCELGAQAEGELPVLAGAGHSATPAGKWRGSAGRPSPMSATTTMGPRPSADPYTFTVTDRKVGMT